MTLPVNPRRNDYTGTGLLAVYAYTFKIFAAADLQVIVADQNGVEYPDLVLGVDFSVAGVGASGGSSISLINAGQAWLNGQGFLQANFHLTILGARGAQQDTSVRNQGPYFPNVIEDAFDKLVVLVQQLFEKAGRTIALQRTSTQTGVVLKGQPNAHANKLMKATADGTGLDFSVYSDTDLAAQANAASASALAAAQSAAAALGSQNAAAASAVAAQASAAAAAASANAAAASAASVGTAFKEVVIGVFAGGNTTFTLAHAPISDAELEYTLGAVPQYPTDYALAGNVVTVVGQNLGGTSALFKYRY